MLFEILRLLFNLGHLIHCDADVDPPLLLTGIVELWLAISSSSLGCVGQGLSAALFVARPALVLLIGELPAEFSDADLHCLLTSAGLA